MARMAPLLFWLTSLLVYSALAFSFDVSNENVIKQPTDTLDNGIPLRILAVGDSIMYGEKSSDGNGFRYVLRNQLTATGDLVDFIGSNLSGNMIDNECEAWPGLVIDEIAGKAEKSIPSQPNLILINAGTTDAILNLDIKHAGQRLGKLIDGLFDDIPGVTIIASTLLPNRDTDTQINVDLINHDILTAIQNFQASGKHIVLINLSSPIFSIADLSDGTHPTDAGYTKMAGIWYQGIAAANKQSWLTAPAKLVSDVAPVKRRSTIQHSMAEPRWLNTTITPSDGSRSNAAANGTILTSSLASGLWTAITNSVESAITGISPNTTDMDSIRSASTSTVDETMTVVTTRVDGTVSDSLYTLDGLFSFFFARVLI